MRSRTRIPEALGLVLLVGIPSAGRAEPPDPLPTRLVAPSPERPMEIRAGTAIVLRARLRSALTPPPGVQQARALVGWSARLDGDGRALAPGLAHRVPLEVFHVDAAADRTLEYDASARVPAWIAPGVYGVHLDTPTGGADAPASVRVVDGAGPRALARRRVVVPLGARLEPPPSRVRWFPASPFDDPRAEPALLAELAGPEQPALAEAVGPVAALRVVPSDASPTVLSRIVWSCDAPADASVFWSDRAGGSATGPRWAREPRVPGPARVDALAVRPDGSTLRGSGVVTVRTRSAGCGVVDGRGDSGAPSLPSARSWAILAAVAAIGNRNRSRRRSTTR